MLPYLNSNFALTLSYLNPALKNPALNGHKSCLGWEGDPLSKDTFPLYKRGQQK